MPDPYISEIKYRGGAATDFVEVAVDQGTDTSGIQLVIYHANGNVRSTNGLGAVESTTFGQDVFTVETGVHRNGAVALVQDGVVLSFVSFDNTVTANAGPAAGLTSISIGSTGTNQSQSLTSGDGNSYTTGPISEGTIPCFLHGTRIAMRDGERRVEDLKPGDRVMVRDGGFAPIRWIGRVTVSARGRNHTKNAPVRIPKGAFERGVPARDLYVSPNHRIWMNDPAFELHFANREVLVPAKHLIGWMGIGQVDYVPEPKYFHILFDQHQIVISDGLPTESFHPGEVTFDQFESESRDELLRLFPDLEALARQSSTARFCLKSHEVPLALVVKSAA